MQLQFNVGRIDEIATTLEYSATSRLEWALQSATLFDKVATDIVA
jgi:hypothetical protein